ncbi:MAG: radical SAM protein [Candidatus Gracilibacteria bacterium]|nr:radical SAM protein [Candidatus Gracilibacteria bacterium]
MEILRKLQNREIDQLVLRVGKKCNFKCLFCNVGDNEKDIKDKYSERELVKEFFSKLLTCNLENKEILISLSGGEPTLYKKDILFIVKFIHKYFLDKDIKFYLELQTNATLIDSYFLEELKKYGLVHILISFHSNDRKIFEELIGVDYLNIKKAINGIDLIQKSGISASFNIIFNKINYVAIPGLIDFLVQRFPEIQDYNIGYFQPNGYGELNFKKLFVRVKEFLPYYLRSIKILENNNKKILLHFTGLPVCLLGSFKKYSLEYNNNLELRKVKSNAKDFLITSLNNCNKSLLKSCYRCTYNYLCSGIWKNFSETDILVKPHKYYGVDKLKDRFIDKGFLLYKHQTIIGSDYLDISNIVKNSIKKGIPKITLYIKDDSYVLSKEIPYGINNIQFFKESNTANYAYIINNIQFFEDNRINLDIYIENIKSKEETVLEKKCNFLNFILL